MEAQDLKQQLDTHIADFAARQEQWDQLIARGRSAEDTHAIAFAKADRRREKAQKLHSAAHIIHHTIDAGHHRAPMRLINRLTGRDEKSPFAMLQRHHATVDAHTSKQSQRLKSFDDLFENDAFLRKYKAQIEKGNYRRADLMLSTQAALGKPRAFLTGGKRGAADLSGRVEQIRALADAHKEGRKEAEKAEKKLAKTEKKAATILHKLLDKDEVHALMRSDMAKNSTDPNVKLLFELQKNHARVGRIQEELSKRRGVIDLDGIAASMRVLHRQALREEREANTVTRAAKARLTKTSDYVEGCHTARRYETVVGHSKTHTSGDILAEMRDYADRDLSKLENREAAERLLKLAEETREQGFEKSLTGVEDNLSRLEQADFVVKDIGEPPHKAYRQKIRNEYAHAVGPSFSNMMKMGPSDFFHLAVVPRVKGNLTHDMNTVAQTADRAVDAVERAGSWLAQKAKHPFSGRSDTNESPSPEESAPRRAAFEQEFTL